MAQYKGKQLRVYSDYKDIVPKEDLFETETDHITKHLILSPNLNWRMLRKTIENIEIQKQTGTWNEISDTDSWSEDDDKYPGSGKPNTGNNRERSFMEKYGCWLVVAAILAIILIGVIAGISSNGKETKETKQPAKPRNLQNIKSEVRHHNYRSKNHGKWNDED